MSFMICIHYQISLLSDQIKGG